MAPGLDVGIDRAEPAAAFRLRRYRSIVDQCMQHAAFEALADFRDCPRGIVVVGKVDLDVIFRAGVPRTIFRKRMARTGDDAPAGRGKADHSGMADAAAGPGKKQRPPWSVVGCSGHKRFSHSSSWSG